MATRSSRPTVCIGRAKAHQNLSYWTGEHELMNQVQNYDLFLDPKNRSIRSKSWPPVRLLESFYILPALMRKKIIAGQRQGATPDVGSSRLSSGCSSSDVPTCSLNQQRCERPRSSGQMFGFCTLVSRSTGQIVDDLRMHDQSWSIFRCQIYSY